MAGNQFLRRIIEVRLRSPKNFRLYYQMEQPPLTQSVEVKTTMAKPNKPKVKKPSAKKEKEPPSFRIEHGEFVICFK
jgi:hypothetical protein